MEPTMQSQVGSHGRVVAKLRTTKCPGKLVEKSARKLWECMAHLLVRAPPRVPLHA
jgi:hypothetical protein